MYRCKKCNGINVYELELRTDYNNFSIINPLNNNIKEITNDDLPYRMYMHFCSDCDDITETEFIKEQSDGEMGEEYGRCDTCKHYSKCNICSYCNEGSEYEHIK